MTADTIESQYSRLARDYMQFIKPDNNQYSKILQQLPYTAINTTSLLNPSLKRAIAMATASSMDFRALTKGLTTSELFKVSSPMTALRKQLADQAKAMTVPIPPELTEAIRKSVGQLGAVTASSKALKEIASSALRIDTPGISKIASQISALSSVNELISPIVSTQAKYAGQIKAIQKIAGTLPSQNVLNRVAKNDTPDIEDIDSDWFDTFPTESNHPIQVKRLKHKVYYRAKLKTAQTPTSPIEHSDSTPKSKPVSRNDLISIIDRVNNLPIFKIIELTSVISYVMSLFGLDQAFINECCRNILFVLSLIYSGNQENK